MSGRTPREVLVFDWTPAVCEALHTVRGDSAFLTFYEALVLLAALHVWAASGQEQSWAIVGDNIGALTVAASQRGRGDLARICREVALLQARHGLQLSVGHLPTKLNLWADPLSRLSAPRPAQLPRELAGLPRRAPPELDVLFAIEPPSVT